MHTAVLSVGVIALFYSAVRYNLSAFRDQAEASGLHPDHIVFEYIKNQQASLNWYFAIGALIAVIFILAYGIYLSHRVAGPIYHMIQYLKGVQAGTNKGQELKLRKNDFFQELADEINKTLKK
jgi:signal transduction histidine kinase